jgi:hypothetical protein
MKEGKRKNGNKRAIPKKNNNDSASNTVHAGSHSPFNRLSCISLAKIPK